MSIELDKYHRATFLQFAKYTAVGALGTAAHYTVLIILVENANIGTVVASSVGAVIGALVNYLLNYYYTFKSDRRHVKAIAKFYIVAGVGVALNAFIIWLAAVLMSLHYMLAQIFATGVVLLWGFMFNRTWTFRTKVGKP